MLSPNTAVNNPVGHDDLSGEIENGLLVESPLISMS